MYCLLFFPHVSTLFIVYSYLANQLHESPSLTSRFPLHCSLRSLPSSPPPGVSQRKLVGGRGGAKDFSRESCRKFEGRNYWCIICPKVGDKGTGALSRITVEMARKPLIRSSRNLSWQRNDDIRTGRSNRLPREAWFKQGGRGGDSRSHQKHSGL